jgi:acetyl-CoA carboxylase biotin carboxylase subunit
MGRAFIGPSVEHLQMFGDKLSAKAAARAAGLPMLDGSAGAIPDLETAVKAAEYATYPVMLKAAAGGGGKGRRVIEDEATLRRVFALTQAESAAAFGSSEVFLEKYLRRPRHIEVQVAADGRGGGIHIGTRDCSLQRRHQKIIEEAPAPFLSDRLREEITEAAAELVRSVNYCTVATVEFLVEDDAFYFLEVNPRIQVEHPVTEAVTGVDLIQEQIHLAAGGELRVRQEDVVTKGHAIEIRVNAEDPWSFLPSPGTVTGYHEPGGPGVRVDSAIHEHAIVQPYYDSLAAKLIVHGVDREHATRRMLGAMEEFIVEGIRTTIPLQRVLLQTDEFRDATFWTRFVDQWVAQNAESKKNKS